MPATLVVQCADLVRRCWTRAHLLGVADLPRGCASHVITDSQSTTGRTLIDGATTIMVNSTAMVKPDRLPAFVRDLATEAKRQGVTASALSRNAKVPLGTAQRLMAGDLNPTASTVESIAKALGVVVRMERKK